MGLALRDKQKTLSMSSKLLHCGCLTVGAIYPFGHLGHCVQSSPSLRSCPLPISPLCLSREEGMIHLFVGSHVKKPESGLFPDWIGNNTNDLRRFDWPKCRHPLVVVN